MNDILVSILEKGRSLSLKLHVYYRMPMISTFLYFKKMISFTSDYAHEPIQNLGAAKTVLRKVRQYGHLQNGWNQLSTYILNETPPLIFHEPP